MIATHGAQQQCARVSFAHRGKAHDPQALDVVVLYNRLQVTPRALHFVATKRRVRIIHGDKALVDYVR